VISDQHLVVKLEKAYMFVAALFRNMHFFRSNTQKRPNIAKLIKDQDKIGLWNALYHVDANVRLQAAKACRDCPDSFIHNDNSFLEALKFLAVSDSDPNVRLEAILSLNNIANDDFSTDLLIKFFNEETDNRKITETITTILSRPALERRYSPWPPNSRVIRALALKLNANDINRNVLFEAIVSLTHRSNDIGPGIDLLIDFFNKETDERRIFQIITTILSPRLYETVSKWPYTRAIETLVKFALVNDLEPSFSATTMPGYTWKKIINYEMDKLEPGRFEKESTSPSIKEAVSTLREKLRIRKELTQTLNDPKYREIVEEIKSLIKIALIRCNIGNIDSIMQKVYVDPVDWFILTPHKYGDSGSLYGHVELIERSSGMWPDWPTLIPSTEREKVRNAVFDLSRERTPLTGYGDAVGHRREAVIEFARQILWELLNRTRSS
jgi:hypothetical protein